MAETYGEFLEIKNGEIDNAAFDLLCSISSEKEGNDNSKISWNMEIIGQVVDFAESILRKYNIPVCRPFYEGDEEIPCYLGNDCKRTDCRFRNKKES